MHDRKRKWWGMLFILPQLIGLIVFALIPLVLTFVISMSEWDGFGTMEFVGFANFLEQFLDPDFKKAMVNTLYYSLLTIPSGIVLGLLLALAIHNIRGKTLYRLFFFMPVVTSSVSIGVIWIWLLNGDFGIINQLLGIVGITGPKWLTDTQWVIPSIAMLSIWWGLGFNMVIFLAGLQGISQTYYEAAVIDGASAFRKFWHITLPLLSPTTFFATIMATISSFQVFDQAFVMTSGGPAKASYTLVYHIFNRGFVESNMGASAAAATILFLMILVLTLIQFKFSRRWVHYEG
ncbi:MAG: sugar ABC transporter permease [Paenibacillus sp.]|uniref:Carbohydrate ABC transporter membrane protein 1, CUT1 family n=1 Tax=Paenibacillus aquistagni TaxID=1852522 RepID=A0A1X7I9M3_9BACL|nr:sugar ABC transporter permease [Paenibacillus aquistagni]MBR2570180.1 sugar ABC transporter permease [Paenibacillus sp.]SMG11101.1 carbohydrate ABC transporter membrane protein 1, CUT1 family [Paenibacillus aquistagni]